MIKRFRWVLLAAGLIASVPSCNSQNEPGPVVTTDRMPVAAGRFYSSKPEELKLTLKGLFDQAIGKSLDSVRALICPHAGYEYSGVVAASGYRQLDPYMQYDNIFVLASSHHVSFTGASVYNKGDYVTPLGKTEVNTELANRLIRDNPVFTFHPDADKYEHSLEVQIPFLQYWMKSHIRLVPIVLGTQNAQSCKKIAEALRPWFNEKNLFIISTDFSHYPAYDNAKTTDKATCDAVVTGSADNLLKMLKENDAKGIPNLATSMCGWTSVLTLLYLTGNDDSYRYAPLHYLNSGDSRYADRRQVVGYWSIGITRKGEDAYTSGFTISMKEKKELLWIARSTIEQKIKKQKDLEIDVNDFSTTLMTPAGAFVTLQSRGNLRGCIGLFSSNEPLYRVVQQMAVAAATQDNRFEPVSASEIDKLIIEISVLSPMKKISSVDEIILGQHGIYIRKGWSTGTFLPQVATETGWSKEEFLGHCSRDKAGIGWDGWKEADIYIYTAEVFSEKEISGHKD